MADWTFSTLGENHEGEPDALTLTLSTLEMFQQMELFARQMQNPLDDPPLWIDLTFLGCLRRNGEGMP